jgi:hypothetical protein
LFSFAYSRGVRGVKRGERKVTVTSVEAFSVERLLCDVDLDAVERRVKRLNKAAEKAGVEGVTVEVERVPQEIRVDGIVKTVVVNKTTISCPTLSLCRPGFTLVAVVTNALEGQDVNAGSRIVTRIGESTEDLSGFRSGSLVCSSCGARRRRNTILVVREEATGELKIFGTKCAAEFVPMGSNGVRALEYLIGFRDSAVEEEEYGEYFGSQPTVFNRQRVLAFAIQLLKSEPYTRANEPGSTREEVRNLAFPANFSYLPLKDREAIRSFERTVAENHVAIGKRIEEVEAWVAGLEGKTDFEANLQAAFEAPFVSHRTFGIVVASVHCFNRHLQIQVEREAREKLPAPEHVGTVGQRQSFGEGEVVFVKLIEGFYGITTLIKIRTEKALLVWFATGEKEIEAGERFNVTATVKKHETYNGEAQTVVNRAKLTKVK